ncbi:helix-turn-helix domain-containing protein, partial [uncultured Aeromicrobium sp.]
AITHLTVILTRPTRTPVSDLSTERPTAPVADSGQAVVASVPVATVAVSRGAGREAAVLLREAEGWSNKQIARHLGVHPSTVGRWFARPALTGPDSEEET